MDPDKNREIDFNLYLSQKYFHREYRLFMALKTGFKNFSFSRDLFTKIVLFLVSGALVFYFFPKQNQFNWSYQKGQRWSHKTLVAPFEFPLLKTQEELQVEREKILAERTLFFRKDPQATQQMLDRLAEISPSAFKELSKRQNQQALQLAQECLANFTRRGILPIAFQEPEPWVLIEQDQERSLNRSQLLRPEALEAQLNARLDSLGVTLKLQGLIFDVLFEVVQPNLKVDESFTQLDIDQRLSEIALTKGFVAQDETVVAEGALVGEETYQRLESLRAEYKLRGLNTQELLALSGGLLIIILLTVGMLFLFISKYRSNIYIDNRQLSFILFNLLFIFIAASLVIGINEQLIYALPFCVLPLTLKAFFDPRVGLFAHVLTVLLVSFMTPNPFEFVVMQILAGMVTLQGVRQLHRRANIFISVFQIVGVYLLGYVAMHLIQGEAFDLQSLTIVGLLLINGLLTLFVQPLIYIYERLFSLTSDVTLFEWSDTRTPLLRLLADKAPGTFNHVIQVAHLAEAAADEIGANTLLVRVGALYHDIGKLDNPTYFTENQKGKLNPHDDLEPQQSAQIIVAHVLKGVELAKKYKLPERIIDFIRTHHGTSLVYFFYKKAQEQAGEGNPVAPETYQYPGPKPFSKETAVLMMADAVEAASKSLLQPQLEELKQFIDRIIERQKEEGQFDFCDITLAEIESVKKVLTQKMVNQFQLRIEYPE